MKAPAYLTRHSNYNEMDYGYLRAKGWTNREIKDRWDEERDAGKGACTWGGFWANQKHAAVTA